VRARVIATLIVLCCASLAYALQVTSVSSTTRPGATNTPMAVLVQVRNTDPNPLTITDVTTMNCGPEVTINQLGSAGLGTTLVTGGFTQYQISTAGLPTDGLKSCSWVISANSGSQGFTTTFDVNTGMMEAMDVQPHTMQLGHINSISETQQIRLTNHAMAPISITADLSWMTSPPRLTFVGGTCDAMDTCTIMLGPKQSMFMSVKCQQATAGSDSGVAHFAPSMGSSQDVPWSCTAMGGAITDQQINIVEPMITWDGAQGVPITQMATVEGMGNAMGSAAIMGPDASAFRFTNPFCGANPLQCAPLMPIPTEPPITLAIECTPDGTNRTAMLVVFGNMADMDFAPLACNTNASGPTINVTPTMLEAGNVRVGDVQGMMQFFIQNDGDQPLSAQVLLNDTNWTASDCTGGCSVMPGALNRRTVDVTFAPTSYGPDNVTLTVDSAVGMPTVSLTGVGVGEELIVTTPNPNDRIEFGTIGKNQLVERTVMLASDGNDGGLMVNIGAPDGPVPPFATSTTFVNMGAVDATSFTVSCQAAAPGGPYQDDISVNSMAYQTNGNPTGMMTITARCTIANTVVQVMPSTLDFGEVRKEPGGRRSIPVMITNPGLPVNLDDVTLANAPSALKLDKPALGVLDTNETRIATIHLLTDDDVVLDNVSLRINVDADLVFPITGKVVTPKAYVTPAVLDLGTACVGTSVTGNVMLVNDGTATLHVQPPTMDNSFTPLFVSPTMYPADGMGAQLAPNDSAIAGVTPSSSSVGPITGMLTWSVDAPGAPFGVPVTLDYIQAGAALSPRQLGFGSIEVQSMSLQQKITLQNCNPTPIIVRVEGLQNVQGGVDAWDVQPLLVEKPLGRHDRLEIFARFTPKRVGKHVARVKLVVDGEQRYVELTGDASGVIRERASLYGCDCSAGGSPWSASPFGFVLWALLRRRRRR